MAAKLLELARSPGGPSGGALSGLSTALAVLCSGLTILSPTFYAMFFLFSVIFCFIFPCLVIVGGRPKDIEYIF